MTARRVLVTGAGGFVGSALARGFAGLGWRVAALDRSFPEGRGAGWDAGVEPVTADLADGVPDDVPPADLVVHAAWVTTDSGALGISRSEYLARNLRPLLAVLGWAARTRPAAFVFVSSSGVFAPGDATGGLTDADAPTGTAPYAAAKRAAELLVPAALDGAAAVHVVRLGYLFGPGEAARPSRTGVSLVAGWIAAARAGAPLEVRADDPARDWTFTPDLAAALERVVDAGPAGRPVHLGSPHVWRDRALAGLVADRFPGAGTVTVPAPGPLKPPMVPSDLPALEGHGWTDPPTGLDALLAAEAAA